MVIEALSSREEPEGFSACLLSSVCLTSGSLCSDLAVVSLCSMLVMSEQGKAPAF